MSSLLEKLAYKLVPEGKEAEKAVELDERLLATPTIALAEAEKLVRKMAEAFPNGKLVFDAANKKAGKLLRKTWLKVAKIKDVGAFFAVSDAVKEITPWSDKIIVASRGYMLGYNDLKDPSVSGFFRFLSKVGDNMMKMQIVKIEFAGK